jgi:mevalonate kinase
MGLKDLIINLFITSTIKKFKASDEIKELDEKLRKNRQLLEELKNKKIINDKKKDALIKEAKKNGIYVKDTMTYDDIIAAFQDNTNEMNRIKNKYLKK